MEKVRIYGDKANEAKLAAKALEQSVDRTHETCQQLISFVHSAQWSGKARDQFLSYMEIIEQYHKNMKSALKKQTKALNNLDGYMSDFLHDSSVKEVKNL